VPLSVVRSITSFISNQVTKTVHQPARLVIIPYHLLVVVPFHYFVLTFFESVAALPRYPRLVPFVLPLIPNLWLRRIGGKAFCHGTGYYLFQRDRPAEAWPWLKRLLHMRRPTTDEYLLGAMCLYHGLGRFRDAMSLLARANEQNFEEAASRGFGNFPFRVLDSVWARHIGHTATIDYVIKLGILEGRRPEDTILYLPPGSPVANRFLLQQVAAHIRLVEAPAGLPFDASAVQAVHYNYLAPSLPDRTTVYFWEIAGKTHRRWQDEGRPALFTFPPEIEARGWAALHRAGVPEGAWFVALHVREGKWDGRNAGLHGVMNADIAAYFPAIVEITRRGGWVIRMGDPGMTRLPPLPNVIDYCHSNLRADWMDVFIAACCRFMVGTTSGPALVPPLYGVPSVLTNWWPPAQRPWHASDIFVPKMLRRVHDGHYLTLTNTLSEPFSYCHSRSYLADYERIYVQDCDPEIIRAAVEEVLARLDGDLSEDPEISDYRSRADQIYESHGAFGMGQLSRSFLRRYSNLIT
jgi:putative glycosyltransferase (TIGR04372 family)